MDKKLKHIVITVLMAAIMLAAFIWCIAKQPDAYSDSERRTLASMPELTKDSLFSAEFMTDFEEYSLDQFPMRDVFRKIKAFAEYNVFQKLDNNDIYLADGHLSKLEYPMNTEMLDHASERMENIYSTYINGDTNVYFSIIPDKNMFLAEENGYLSLDYNELAEYMHEKTEYMDYIDIFPYLSADDYYNTDTHWRQECIGDVAEEIASAMGTELNGQYTVNELDNPFYGVYCGQSAISVRPDTINYLTSDVLENCTLTSYDTGKAVEKDIYDMEKAYGKDPYEMFMSGADAILVLENPNAETDRQLVVFRDSFGSSIVPYFAEGYSKITLVDIRYIQSSFVGNFVDFENCDDVLFLYSTMLLNSSLAMK